MDAVFKALADASRRRLLDSLNARNGQNLRELCAELDMARQSVSKHLSVLEAANLVTTVWRGREKLHYLNAEPINAITDRWITQYDRERVRALADLKHALEMEPMSSPAFVYTTYIKTTPERLWQALTDPAFTRRYWGVTFESDWHTGSSMVWEERGARTEDPAQVVLESEPYRRLSYTWHTFTPEWAESAGVGDEVLAEIAGERRSKVTFEIEPLGHMVKLTVVHDDFDSEEKTMTVHTLELTQIPDVEVGMLVRRPRNEVFQAFVDPSITSTFWFTKSSGRMTPGADLQWDWEMYDVSAKVRVHEVEDNSHIRFEWGDDWGDDKATTVEVRFTPRGNDATYVEVTETGLAGESGDEIASLVAGSTSGFTIVLCALKALLEHDVVLTAVRDRFPDGLGH
jgi:uncharacterized protein YndB with AHSA1/START domain/DNA-binding transcriptional ArsR family regulator